LGCREDQTSGCKKLGITPVSRAGRTSQLAFSINQAGGRKVIGIGTRDFAAALRPGLTLASVPHHGADGPYCGEKGARGAAADLTRDPSDGMHNVFLSLGKRFYQGSTASRQIDAFANSPAALETILNVGRNTFTLD
jgi:hypothetical protein